MTSETEKAQVSENLLAAILDRLIPAIGDLPSAGQMGLTEEIVRLAAGQARFRREFENSMSALASMHPDFESLSGAEQDDALRSFQSSSPAMFSSIRTICYIVYYKDSRVHKRIGWSGATPQPDGNEMEPWDESVLENIRKREPFWRKVD
jgi:hypothetical protein